MTEIGEKASANKPLNILCEDTLKAIASPPGRIYAQHKLTTSPTNEVAEAAKAIAEAIKSSAKS
jgi:hypothetical protein